MSMRTDPEGTPGQLKQLHLGGPFEEMMNKAIRNEITPAEFLVTLLEKQQELQIALHGNGSNPNGLMEPVTRQPDASIKDNAFALIVEVIEIVAEVNWKNWKQSPSQVREIDRRALLLEIVDAFQFLANIINSAGFSAQDIASGYAEKLVENYRRLEQVKAANGSK